MYNADLRSPLTSHQKSAVTKLWQKYHSVITTPAKFHLTTVSKKKAKLLDAVGFMTIKSKQGNKRRVVVPVNKGDIVRIENARIVQISGTRGHRTDTYLFKKPRDIQSQIDSMKNKTLKRNQFWGLREGDHRQWRYHATNLKDLENYIKRWMPAEQEKRQYSKEQIEAIKLHLFGGAVSLVTLTTPEGFE